MPLLAINAIQDEPAPHRGGRLAPVLDAALAVLPQGAPVVIMIHGYTFSPDTVFTDPHRHILALRPRKGCWKALSWPRHLGFGHGRADEGLCIGFGWEARGTIWQAWRSAATAGLALAELIRLLQARRPGLFYPGPVHIIAHSLGARVALKAMAALPAGALGRVILIAAAEFQSTAAAALSSPAGQTAEVVNVTSAENAPFDRGLAWLVKPPVPGDEALGAGLWTRADNWLDVQIDRPETRRALRALGHRIPAPRRKICHWWGYLRPGLMLLYRDLIRRPDSLSLPMLRAALPAAPRRYAKSSIRAEIAAVFSLKSA